MAQITQILPVEGSRLHTTRASSDPQHAFRSTRLPPSARCQLRDLSHGRPFPRLPTARPAIPSREIARADVPLLDRRYVARDDRQLGPARKPLHRTNLRLQRRATTGPMPSGVRAKVKEGEDNLRNPLNADVYRGKCVIG